MNHQWLYAGCDAEDERAIAAHWEELQPGWDARLEALDQPPDEATFSVIHDAGETPEWSVQATLVFPGDVIAEEAESRRMKTALEEAVNRLSRRLDEVQALQDGQVQRRRGVDRIVPFLERARTVDRLQEFAAFLRPILASLAPYARRELAMHEMEGDLEEGELEVDELLDETLLHAWDHFEHRPRSLPVDAWLAGLIGQVLEEQMRGASRPHVSLDEPAAAESRRPVDDESSTEGWIEAMAVDDIELGDLLPGRPAPDAWERLDPDRRELGLNRMLSRLTREQRQSLLLSAVHGLDAAEIAAIQGEGVSAEQAQAAVDAGRDSLARLIEQQETWTEFQEDFERTRRDPRRRNT